MKATAQIIAMVLLLAIAAWLIKDAFDRPQITLPTKPDSSAFYLKQNDSIIIIERKTIERISTINNIYHEKKSLIDSIAPSALMDSIRAKLRHFNDSGEAKNP